MRFALGIGDSIRARVMRGLDPRIQAEAEKMLMRA
jgi:hypothetical protein